MSGRWMICVMLCLAMFACKDRSPPRETPPAPVAPRPDAMVLPPPTPVGYGPIDENDPAYKDMVSIPAGILHFDEAWPHMHSYYLDRTEVTVAQYRECVSLGACRAPQPRQPYYGDEGCVHDLGTWSQPDADDHPITCVSAADAYAYCMQLGKRLPTRDEWMYAARGNVDKRRYPWGDEKPTCSAIAARELVLEGDRATPCPKARTRPVGTTKLDVSPFGVHDLAGNVSEIVLGVGAPRPQPDARVMSAVGGGVTAYAEQLETDFNAMESPTRPGVGFRCAAGGPPY